MNDMEITVHDFGGLIGRRVTLLVSDPWDFGTEHGVGPFGGTIQQVQGEVLAVSLDRDIMKRTGFVGDRIR
jgi:hypothetical protein